MDKSLLVLLITSGIAFVLMWIHARRNAAAENPFAGHAEGSAPEIDAFADTSINTAPGNFEFEVRILIDYGNKAAAVRVVREKIGLDLKDATELVDAMEQGAPIPIHAASPAAGQGSSIDNEARELVSSGKLIEAIKLVREQKGLDLKQAKAYVEQL